MKQAFTHFIALALIAVVALFGCSLGSKSTPTTDPALFVTSAPANGALSLSVAVINKTDAFDSVGDTIHYRYLAANIGAQSLTGTLSITDDKTSLPACPPINTIGNLDDRLDPNESIECASSYAITQADLDAGSVVNQSIAQIGGALSNAVMTTTSLGANQTLTVRVTPNVEFYTAAGQTITYTYRIRNRGTNTLGPAQFIVIDSLIPNPINCEEVKSLAPDETLTCSAAYTVAQNDMNAQNITNSVTAQGGGATTAKPTTSVVPKGASSSSGNYAKGSTITHQVVSGEWLYQIARCYGADIKATLNANPQIPDPHWILPAMTVNVPNIGSNGTIYGPPCVGFYVAQSGDTWETISGKFNADATVLKATNKTIASPTNSACLKIPLNSAGGAIPAQPALSACPSAGGAAPTQPPVINTIPVQPPVTLNGSVPASGKIQYKFTAAKGQALSVAITNAPANELALGITSPAGGEMKALDTNLTFTGTVPADGDVLINIAAISGASAKTFTLEIALNTPSSSVFERVADINPGPNGSDPAYLEVFNGRLYFRATGNDNAGAELWGYNPATESVSRAADVFAGPDGGNPNYLAAYDGELYFGANGNDGAGVELWRFNGSTAGRMPEINSGPDDSNPAYLTPFKDKLYFSAKGSDNTGVELWRTDGIGVERVTDINPGAGDSNPSYLAVFNDALYFSAVSNDGAGVEIWKYDGVNPPTRVTDINPGIGNSNPSYLAVFNNALYFAANANDGFGIELWKYDGVNPPTRITDINPGAGDAAPAFLAVFNNMLYFSAVGNDNAGFGLWRYNGNDAPTRIAELNLAGNSSPSYLTVFNSELYFQANGNDGAGAELWKFKGP
ncbi:MAG: hypothetical protein B6D38_09770 [Anaerolineae bacterium UTCFX1]|jgi:ELWxxDGT repeat protein|nr:MAG: hypothetical protein B6D38_09770 [Anaerolineae bacterium UTCFX1]